MKLRVDIVPYIGKKQTDSISVSVARVHHLGIVMEEIAEALRRARDRIDLDAYRSRVQVTEDDLRELSAQNFLSWISKSEDFSHEPGGGVYRVWPNGRRRFIPFGARVVNVIAKSVDRAPLDILDEMKKCTQKASSEDKK
jgi:hypothetical protein